ncbi:MAG: tripartite tricarboxylate transporter substrate binding protein [Bradyrhizobium sp.]|nr:tripartite tricarboxylate transporter substrate binding protein [Bradyrhizobium sp.]
MRTHWTLLCTAVLLGLLTNAPAKADDYPARAITIVVSLAAGSGMDAIARLYADKLSEAFGKPVIVENKPGAATTLAANQVAKAPPDGYTLVVLTSIALSINPTLFKQLNYDPQDFTPISLYVKSPFILVIDPSLPAKMLSEFAELARHARPPLSYASIGAGSVQHMSMEFAKKRLGFDATHVPYRATPQSVTDLMGGHVAASFLEAGLSMPLIKEGKLRALAVSSAQRLPLLPDVPPFAEAAGAADYEGVSWHMLLVPAKTPQPIVDRLYAEMKRIMQAPEMRAKIAALGLIPNDSPSIEEMRSYIQSEHLKWGAMVKQLGLEGSQ